MSGWRKIWANGLPNEDRSPNPGHRMAAKWIEFPWQWTSSTFSTNLDVIWGMSVNKISRIFLKEYTLKKIVFSDIVLEVGGF